MNSTRLSTIALSIALGFGATTAQAELARVGPNNPANGFPQWYQDKTGLALDFCAPQTQADLENGLCLILPADVPGGLAPEVFPNQFSEEHFWWAASAAMPTNGAGGGSGSATLTLALEGAFGTGVVQAGQQITFGRIRVKITNLPSTGTYKVTHPYGVETFQAEAGSIIFFTDDAGVNCPAGVFNCALGTRVGPFLVPAASPGGVAKPFLVTDTGTYISDGIASEFVTGSPFGTNLFRIEGPNIGGPGIDVMEIDTFTLIGKVHTDPIPSPMGVARATYTRSAAGGAKMDVFADAAAAINAAAPTLSLGLVTIDPAGGTPTPTGQVMTGDGKGHFYGQASLFDPALLPAEVTVFNNADVPVSFVTHNLVDEVDITQAEWDPVAGTLTVAAQSGDQYGTPTLLADISGYHAQAFHTLTGGAAVISGVTVPPPVLEVISSYGGRHSVPVTTRAMPAAAAVANNDFATTPEDTPAVIDLGANDQNAVVGSIAIVGNPVNGTVALNPLGPNGEMTVTYVPKANFNGGDSFTYTVSGTDGRVSNLGTVAVTVDPVNDVPVANNDVVFTIVGKSQNINVTANDTDMDGNLVKSSVALTSAPALGSATVANGIVTYTPPASIPTASTNVSFGYTVSDAAGAVSNAATITVRLYASETISITKAIYTTKTKRWDISGTSSISGGQTAIAHSGSTLATPVIGQAVVDPAGNFDIQVPSSTVPVSADRRLSVETTVGGQRLSFPVTVK